jgi:hypothetical protein
LHDILKRHVLACYAQRDNLGTFVESGTYLGLEALQQFILSIRADVAIEMRNNVVRVTRKQAKRLHG